MPLEPTTPGDHFSLWTLAGGLVSFAPPDGPFDPAGTWTNVYKAYSLTQGLRPAGTLTIARAPRPGGGSVLTVTESLITATSAVQRHDSVIEAQAIGVGRPLSWTLHSRILQGSTPMPGTEVHVTGALAPDNRMSITAGGTAREVALPAGVVAMNWVLMEAVQRLPGAAFGETSFTLVDHADQPKPGGRLAHRKEALLRVGGTSTVVRDAQPLERGTRFVPRLEVQGGTPVECDVYEQTGEGILPIVYWVQKGGRLLFVSAGIEGYILDAAASS